MGPNKQKIRIISLIKQPEKPKNLFNRLSYFWYHVTGVYSLADGYIRTYVDGELDRELETTQELGASPGALVIGCEPFSTGQYNFNGVMDDIRVYDKALSEAEARYLANN